MIRRIPIRKLIVTSIVIAFIFTGLIGVLLRINVPAVPNFYRIIIDALLSIIIVGFIHIAVLRFAVKRFAGWPVYKISMFRYVLTFVLTFVYTMTVELVMGVLWEPGKLAHMQSKQGLFEQLTGGAIIALLILASHNQVLQRQRRIDAELELSEARAANVEAINLVLQQQIQPHFLFNSLNVLNGLYKRDYQLGHTYMLHLASFLRATISSTKQNVLSIAEEVKICNDYVAMQKMRFNNAMNFRINLDQRVMNTGFVPSFSIQPLVENAIKHNELTDENPLYVDLYTKDGFLFVKNNINVTRKPVASTGQGLANLIKRYELLSGDEVQIVNDDTSFIVRLKILNDEYCHN